MRRLLLFFLLVCSLWQAGYALQTTPDTARLNQYLSAFNQAPGVKAANAFFQYLNSEEFTDSPIQFSSATHLDTLRQQVWYWAAEWLFLLFRVGKVAAFGTQGHAETQ